MRTRTRLLLAALTLTAALAGAEPAAATNYTVNVGADAGVNNCATTCSLRSALVLADNDATDDVITIAAGIRVELAQGVLQAGNGTGVREVEIRGNGATVDANGGSGVMRFTGNSDDRVTLSDLTLTGGVAAAEGGAFDADESNFGALVLQNVTMTGNTAAMNGGAVAVGQNNTLEVADSAFTQNTSDAGGAIYSQGTTTIDESEFAGNTATDGSGKGGGGLSFISVKKMTVTDSTFSGNEAGDRSGAIHLRGDALIERVAIVGNTAPHRPGIGLDLNPGNDVVIRNATVTGNVATVGDLGGAGIGLFGEDTSSLVIDSSTIAGNTLPASSPEAGSALVAVGELTLRNTILAGPRACKIIGTMTSQGGNLDSGRTCGFSSAADRFDADPKLAPLAANGGDVETMALRPGSAAIDVGKTCPAVDARGIGRPQGPTCDSGAFEAEKADLVTTLAASPSAARVGERVTATATVVDRATHDAPGTVVTLDTSGVPATVVSAATSSGAPCGTAIPVSCSLGTLQTEAPVTITVVLAPQAAGPMTLVATATNERPDAVAADDRAQSTVDVAALPVPPAAAPDPAAAPPAVAPLRPVRAATDRRAPTVSAGGCTKRLRAIRRARACTLPVRLDEAGRITATATIGARVRGRTKQVTVATGSVTLARAGGGRLVVRLTSAGRKRLARGRSASLRLVLVAVDRAGNRATTTQRLVLRV